MKPGDIPIHLARVSCNKGAWIIDVRSGLSGQDSDHVALRLLLERNLDEEHVVTRRLFLYVSQHDLQNRRDYVLDRIRIWVEQEEGDGELNLVAK